MFTSTKKIQNRISKGQKTNSNPNILTEVRIFELRLTSLLRANSSVLRRLLNEGSDGADVTSGDSPFQTRAATTGKARSPTVVRRVGGTMSKEI